MLKRYIAFALSILGLISWWFPALNYIITISALILAILCKKQKIAGREQKYTIAFSIIGLLFTITFSIISVIGYKMI